MTQNTSEDTTKAVRRSNEVCQELDIQPYVLKFWEAEFPLLSRRIGPKRLYGPEDFQIALSIKRLLQDDGLTLAEAREEIAGQLSRAEPAPQKRTSAPTAGRHPSLVSVAASIVDDTGGSATAEPGFGHDSLVAQLSQVIQERDAAEGREARAQREGAELKSALAAFREELNTLRDQLTAASQHRDDVLQQLQRANQELSAAREQLEQAHAATTSAQQEAHRFSEQLALVRVEEQARREELERSKHSEGELLARLEHERESLQEASARGAKLSETQQRLDSLERELNAEKTRTADGLNQTRALQEKLKSEGEKHGKWKLDLTREIDALLAEARTLAGEVAAALSSVGGEKPEPGAGPPSTRTTLLDREKPTQP